MLFYEGLKPCGPRLCWSPCTWNSPATSPSALRRVHWKGCWKVHYSQWKACWMALRGRYCLFLIPIIRNYISWWFSDLMAPSYAWARILENMTVIWGLWLSTTQTPDVIHHQHCTLGSSTCPSSFLHKGFLRTFYFLSDLNIFWIQGKNNSSLNFALRSFSLISVFELS